MTPTGCVALKRSRFVRNALKHYTGAPDFENSWFSSSLQMMFDLSDLDASLFMMSGGQSGHFRSPLYHDLTPAWIRGERFTIPMDREQIDVAAELRLTLSP